MITRTSAPGKVILMGEHVVVYGRPALISTIDLRLTVTVTDHASTEIVVPEGRAYIEHIRDTVLCHFRIRKPPRLRIDVASDIPIGYHLGSSAALAAALVGALTYHIKKIWNPTLINQLAYESEGFIHKNASGVDPAAVVSGGLVWYRRELEFLRSIWQFPFGIPDTLNNFYFIDTGRPEESTGDMVERVAHRYGANPAAYGSLFDKNEEQTKRIIIAIKNEDEKSLADSMRKGQKTLERIGVVSKAVTPLVRSIEKTGGAAKILGGGGHKGPVGFMLCYSRDIQKVRALCAPYGYTTRKVVLGGSGVRLEKE